MELVDIVDLDRYPIDRPDSAAMAELIANAKARLAEDGCAVVKGFVRPPTVAQMADESHRLRSKGKHENRNVTVYPPYGPAAFGDWPEGHPRTWQHMRTNRFVPYDLIDRRSPLRALYESRPMTDLIRRCTGGTELYLYGDPLGACVLSLQEEGEELPWHFDVTHFVVSLLLQKPEEGGDFEYAPYIKSKMDENYDAVADVLAGRSTKVVTLDLQPGDLQLFEGRYSLHRVTAPSGPIRRSIALFSYCEQPGEICDEFIQREQYGRVARTPLIVESAAAREPA